jgi:hypothetical protein
MYARHRISVASELLAIPRLRKIAANPSGGSRLCREGQLLDASEDGGNAGLAVASAGAIHQPSEASIKKSSTDRGDRWSDDGC